MSRVLDEEIKRAGLEEHLSGTQYIREAVAFVAEHSAPRQTRMYKEVYPTLARRYGASASSVERAMRYAIDKAGHKETNGEFIHGMAVVVKAYED